MSPQATGSTSTSACEGATQVSQLELFFDLVFVFTITQLTTLLSSDGLTWRNIWHAVVALGLIFWMYDGYAWLTNAVPARGKSQEGLLIGAMAGYLVLAIAVPSAFQSTGLTFGLAYLVITAVLGLLLSAGLWWSYFGSSDTDDDQSDVERAFAAATGPDRPRLAFFAFGYAFFVMLFGIALTAVGLRQAVARPNLTLSTAAAFALSGGVVIFLLGLTAFRVILGLKAWHRWSAVSLLLLVAVPFATDVSALAGLAVLVSGLGLLLATNEQREGGPRRSPRPDPVPD